MPLLNAPCCYKINIVSKAFDSVPHKLLLDKLVSLGVPSHLLCWIRSYLIHRLQKVSVDGVLSSPCHATSGVPQGSVLGPLLFSIYINGLTELPVSSPSSLVLYADDILLSHVISSPSCMASVQSDLDLIAHWINSHLLL